MRLRPCVIVSFAGLGILAWAPGGAAETIRVGVDKLTFTPAQISARIGDTIEWTSTDFVAHTATGRNKEWDVTIPAKGSGRVTLMKSGIVDYYCRFHPNMVGRVAIAD
jgi:plastocyanin